MTNLGLYIHIPFCVSKCPYCDFYSSPNRENKERYIKAVCRHLKKEPYHYNSVFIGGGTPSLLSPSEFEKIFGALEGKIADGAEITTELNPSDVDLEFFKELKAKTPINRISLGVQSATDERLKFLGRRHSSEVAKNAIICAKNANFCNISADFIIGLPDETDEEIKADLEFIEEMELSHISAYILKVEENTPFYKSGVGERLDDDLTADHYLMLSKGLKDLGFEHYEISNFARNGMMSRHNLKYWRGEEYLGIGPGAHSFIDGKRFFTEKNTEEYIKAVSENRSPYIGFEKGGEEKERVMLSLRLKEGIKIGSLSKETQKRILALSPKYEASGLITLSEGRLSLTEKGFLLSNLIISDLIF